MPKLFHGARILSGLVAKVKMAKMTKFEIWVQSKNKYILTEEVSSTFCIIIYT